MRRLAVLIILILCQWPVAGQLLPLDQANRLFLEKNFQGALSKYQTVVETPFRSDADFALFQIGECYRLLGNTGMASRAYQKLTRNYPQSTWADNAYLALANQAAMAGKDRLDDALIYYESIISTYPGSDSEPAAWLGSARIRVQLNFFEYAEFALDNLIAKFEGNNILAEAYFERGQILSNSLNPRRNKPLAISSFEVFLNKFPYSTNAVNAYFALGNLYWELNQHKEAIANFNQVVLRYPDSFFAPLAQTNIGLCYTDMNRAEDAINAYRDLLRKFSQPASVRENINRLIEKLQSQEKDKLQISAWVANVDKDKRTAHYEGDVRIKYGKTEITADLADVDLAENIITAEGKVRLHWGVALNITSDHLIIKLKEKLAHASGDVVLSQRVGETVTEKKWATVDISLTDGATLGHQDIEKR